MDEWLAKGDKDMLRMVIEQRIGKPSQSLAVKHQDDRPNFNLFYMPRMQATVKIFEDEIKREICQSIVSESRPE